MLSLMKIMIGDKKKVLVTVLEVAHAASNGSGVP